MAATTTKPTSQKKFSVGDTILVVESLRRSPPRFHEVRIDKVGPKYITFSLPHGPPYRATIEGLTVYQRDYHCRDLSVYLSREQYDLELELCEVCEKIRNYVRENWNLARELTIEQARQITDILELDKEKSND